MGLDENEIDITTYKDESDIVEDIKLVGTSDDNNPIISMTINTFIPESPDSTKGQKIKVNVTSEWKIVVEKKMKQYSVKEIVDIKSDTKLGDEIVYSLKSIFRGTAIDLMNKLYRPYMRLHQSDEQHIEKLIKYRHDNSVILKNLLPEIEDPFFKKTKQPTEKVKPSVDNKTSEEPSKPSMWTSTSSWASQQ